MEHEVMTTEIRGINGFETEIGPSLKELAKAAEKLGRLKKLGLQADLMNLMDLRKQLDDAKRLSADIKAMADNVSSQMEAFAVAGGVDEQTEWWVRFRQAFHNGYPPVEGEYPTFQVFPVEVRVDLANELVLINNRTVRVLHPVAVAGLVEKEWDRLNRERFNAGTFAKALVRAYDLLLFEMKIKAGGKEPGKSIPLRVLHQTLALKAGVSGYSMNQFAFDIYRLRRSPYLVMDGRRLEFGTSRNRGLIITHPGGRQENLGSLELVAEGAPS